MAQFRFFITADADLDCAAILAKLNQARSGEDFSEADVDSMIHLTGNLEDGLDSLADWREQDDSTFASLYTLDCESDVMEKAEADEALCLTLFEGGSLNADLRLISFAAL